MGKSVKKKSLFFSFMKNKFVKHIFFALITLIFLFFLWLKYLDIYTMHNKHLEVPDFTNYHISKLDSIVEVNDLRYIIIDSIFDSKKEKATWVIDNSGTLAATTKQVDEFWESLNVS